MDSNFKACRAVTLKYEGEQCERMKWMAEHFGNEVPKTCTTSLNNAEWCEGGKTADEAVATLKRITEGLCPKNPDIDEPIPTCEFGAAKVNENRWGIFKNWVASLL